MINTDLTLTEKFLLLAMHPEKGRFTIAGMQLAYGIAGGLLLELSMQERIAIEDGKVVSKKGSRITDPVLSEVSDMMASSEKKRKVRYWTNKIYKRSNKYKKVILEGMEKIHLVRIERKKFLFIPYTLYFLRDKRTRDNLIRHLKKAILYPSSVEITGEDMALMGLVEACKMHKTFASDRQELKRIRKELKEVIKNSPIAGVVDQTIKDVQAALLASVVVVGAGR